MAHVPHAISHTGGVQLRQPGYAFGDGAIFLCHIGTNVHEEGGIWHADAVYSVSPDLLIAARANARAMASAKYAEQGIPTV